MHDVLKRWEMRARANMPAGVRTLYRLARSFRQHQPARQLPQGLLEGARLCASRETMLAFLPRGGVVAEIGTLRGDFARAILRETQPKELHLIDIDYSAFDASGLGGPGVKRRTGLSYDVVATYQDGYFDWIYVDADHSYEGVLRDARAAMAPLKPGGLLIFNDFCHIDPKLGRYGVKRAATDFILETGWPVAFLALEGDGLYDIAIRKPEIA